VSSKLQITPSECRLRAAECHKMAQNARRAHVRDTLAEIERMWNRLAVEAEVSESMLARFLEDAAFGPDEIAIMVAAYEVGLTEINSSGHNDPETLAQTIVMLANRSRGVYVEIEPRSSKLDKSSSHRLVRHRPGRHTQLRTWEHPEGAVVFQHACKMGLEASWGRATGLDDRQTGSNSKNRPAVRRKRLGGR